MKKALLLGISDYGVDPLPLVMKDIEGLDAILRMPEYGYEVKVVINENAKTANIRREIASVLSDNPESVIIYFSGHGGVTRLGAYFITIDGQEDIDDGLSLKAIEQCITQFSEVGTDVVVIGDFCYSGGIQAGDTCVRKIDPDRLDIYMHLGSMKRAVLLSSMEQTKSFEGDNGGVFSNALRDGLLGGAALVGGNVTTNSLFDYINEKLVGSHQTPVYRGDMVGSIILGRNVKISTTPIDTDAENRILGTITKSLGDIQSFMASEMSNPERWRSEGWTRVCDRLSSLVDWAERKDDANANLRSNTTWKSEVVNLYSKLQYLSNIEIGSVLRGWEFVDRLGGGSFGSVWKVRRDDKYLAVKVFHATDLFQREKRKRFAQGYEAMKRLDHPNIVKVYTLSHCPVMFEMDFIAGANLREWNPWRSDHKGIVNAICVIADTLYHSHRMDVIHRDVKPENVIIQMCDDGAKFVPHLTDFDLAWYSTASVQTKEAIGTIYYGAPEQLAKPNTNDARSPAVDVYSIGQLMYFMVTGSDPVPMEMADNTKRLHEELRKWPTAAISTAMQELYKEATAKDSSKRIREMKVFLSRIQKIKEMIREYDDGISLTAQTFVAEVMHSMGAESVNGGNTYTTIAGRTALIPSLTTNGIIVTIQVLRELGPETGMDSHMAKRKLLARIFDTKDRSIGYEIEQGNSRPFEVHLKSSIKQYTWDEVERIRNAINITVKSIETFGK